MSGDQLVNAYTVIRAMKDLLAEVLQESSHRAGQDGFWFPRAVQSVFGVDPKSVG